MEETMIRKIAITSGLAFVIAIALAPQRVMAGTIGPHSEIIAGDPLLQLAQGRSGSHHFYCRRVRRECAERWDFGTRAYWRCVHRHGC